MTDEDSKIYKMYENKDEVIKIKVEDKPTRKKPIMKKTNIEDLAETYPTEGLVFEGGKSFYVFANNKTDCFKCGYCILSSIDYLQSGEKSKNSDMPDFKKIHIGTIPSDLNPLLKSIPVAVNNAYGDAGLQWRNTVQKLECLLENEHTGVVGIITKDWFKKSGIETLKSYISNGLNIVVLQSMANLPQLIEPPSMFLRVRNVENLHNSGIPVIPYFRPIMPGINDNHEVIESTIKMFFETGITNFVYSGMFGTPEVLDLLEKRTGKRIKPPHGYNEWMQGHKLVSKNSRALIEGVAKEYGLQAFRKTSCGVSATMGLPADYNVHYSRPEKYNCIDCSMDEKCSEYASNTEKNIFRGDKIADALDVIGAKATLEESKGGGKCKLEEVCEKACTSCDISKGTKLHVKGTYSLGELGLVRWLTGLTTYADKELDTNRMFFMYNNIDRGIKEK